MYCQCKCTKLSSNLQSKETTVYYNFLGSIRDLHNTCFKKANIKNSIVCHQTTVRPCQSLFRVVEMYKNRSRSLSDSHALPLTCTHNRCFTVLTFIQRLYVIGWETECGLKSQLVLGLVVQLVQNCLKFTICSWVPHRLKTGLKHLRLASNHLLKLWQCMPLLCWLELDILEVGCSCRLDGLCWSDEGSQSSEIVFRYMN